MKHTSLDRKAQEVSSYYEESLSGYHVLKYPRVRSAA